MFRDAFGLAVSEGALMNMFIRSHPRFKIEAEKAKTILRAARVVASDETGVRIEGTNSYHWVFHCKDAVVHQPYYFRATRVVGEMMDGSVPEVWISDRYLAQQSHGIRHQTCLAHLARDTAFALEHGSDDLPFRFKLWLGKAFDLAKAIADFAASTVLRKKRGLEKQLAALLVAATRCDLARELQAKIGRARNQLLTFCDYPGEVDVNNNTLILSLSKDGAQAETLCDPAKGDQRLSRHVGCPSRSGRAHRHRHRAARRQKSLRRHRRHLGLTSDQAQRPPSPQAAGVGDYPIGASVR
jgi:transposase